MAIAAFFGVLAIAGIAVSIPNAIVASNSNDKVQEHFQAEAWKAAPLAPGIVGRGLIFLREEKLDAPHTLTLVCRAGGSERRFELAFE